jgi:hypothetical protein
MTAAACPFCARNFGLDGTEFDYYHRLEHELLASSFTGLRLNPNYFPMQKLEKIRPSRSSLDTSPVISPSA